MTIDPLSFLRLFGEQHWLQTFDDRKRKDRKDLIGDLWVDNVDGPLNAPELDQRNEAGAGVYFCVNQLKHFHKKRMADNVEAIRAFFVDLDGAPLQPVLECGLKPNIITKSSSNRFHAYWIMNDFVAADRKLFKALQHALAGRFDGDKSVSDLCRVMRLPGFYNMKGDPFMVSYEVLREEGYSLEEVKNEFETAACVPGEGVLVGRRNAHNIVTGLRLPDWISLGELLKDVGRGNIKAAGEDFEFDAARLRGAMLALDVDDYETWITVMLALKGAAAREDAELSEEEAFEYFLSWSETGNKFDEHVLQQKWEGCIARGEIGLGTLFLMAKDKGWCGERRNYWKVEDMKEYLAKI